MPHSQKLGPFELLRVLGRGGMGTVYEAKDTKSGEIVAVKALAPAYSFDEHFRNRFEAEIDALMQLDHPNIVRLLSYGQDDGNLFFAMELVDGNSLFTEQKQGQIFSFPHVIDIARQICAGLRHAHDRGIIHRDLKPGNLMLNSDNIIKITDFGIAKSFGGTHITSEGNVVGTMDFMAPEQARGRAVTARSDLFSLGAVMYAMLSGKAPFLKDTADETFATLLSAAPPTRLAKLAPGIPVELAKFVHRLLEKDPEKRFGTAQAADRQLQYILESLRETPQADTQVVGREGDATLHHEKGGGREVDSDANTYLVKDPTANQAAGTKEKTSNVQATQLSDEADPNGTVPSNHSSNRKLIEEPPQDYYAEVTPQLRKERQTRGGDGQVEHAGRVWPIAIALAVVVGLIAFGSYTVLKRPSPETLLAKFRQNQHNPDKVSEDIETFLKYYPDHEQIGFVEQLHEYANAIAFRKRLFRKRVFSREPLDVIQRQFMEVTDMQGISAPDAVDRLSYFIREMESEKELSELETTTIGHAKVYLKQLKIHAASQIEEYVEHIESKISAAKGISKSSKLDAIALLQAIIANYEDQEWATEVLDEARKEKKLLESESS